MLETYTTANRTAKQREKHEAEIDEIETQKRRKTETIVCDLR